jgi:hypothetical protein
MADKKETPPPPEPQRKGWGQIIRLFPKPEIKDTNPPSPSSQGWRGRGGGSGRKK